MKRTVLFLFAVLAMLLAAQPAQALVTGVQASPAQRNISFSGGASTLTVTWIITRTAAGGPVDLRAAPGRLRVGNVVLSTTPARSKRVSGNPTTITFVETVSVPSNVMRLALQSNNGTFEYERDFADDPPALTFSTGVMNVFVTGGMGGPLSLAEVTLSFDNGATFTTVQKDGALRAQARIRSNGSGQLRGVWEVSDNGAESSAFFRPLRTVTVTLTGQRYVTEFSPPLPTKSDGRVNARFRITDPPGSDIRPQITYFVTDTQVKKGGALALAAPADGAAFVDDATFQWAAVKGAAAYRLQVLDAGGNNVASMLVKGTGTRLSGFVRAQLQGPAVYKWRVTASDADGNLVAVSETRSMRVKAR